MSEHETCSRCNVAMELQPLRYEGAIPDWRCPCCRSVLHTARDIRASAEAEADKRGITYEELMEENQANFRDFEQEPMSEAELAHVKGFTQRQAEEWTPACVHDTENPWRPSGLLGDSEQ